jgi:hypothetical protein
MSGNVPLEVIGAVAAAGQVVLIWVFWTFKGKVREEMQAMELHLREHMDASYVRVGECVLRSGANRLAIAEDRADAAAACIAAAGRDSVTQGRIDELVRTIASRAAETIMVDREILNKINALLDRSR